MVGSLNVKTLYGTITEYTGNSHYGEGTINVDGELFDFTSACFYGSSKSSYPQVGLKVAVTVSLSTGNVVFVFVELE